MKLEEIISEGAVRQMKKQGDKIVTKWRCSIGKRKGKLVSGPGKCGTKIDPKRKRIGKKSARMKKGVRILKTKISKRKPISKIISRINKRLSHKSSMTKVNATNTTHAGTISPKKPK